MKRILVLVLILLGFVLASCEEGEYAHPYGYYGYPGGVYRGPYPYGPYSYGPYPYGRYPYGHYPYGRYPDGYYHRGYRLVDETEQYDGTLQVESTVEP
jgi:hypothetical protein